MQTEQMNDDGTKDESWGCGEPCVLWCSNCNEANRTEPCPHIGCNHILREPLEIPPDLSEEFSQMSRCRICGARAFTLRGSRAHLEAKTPFVSPQSSTPLPASVEWLGRWRRTGYGDVASESDSAFDLAARSDMSPVHVEVGTLALLVGAGGDISTYLGRLVARDTAEMNEAHLAVRRKLPYSEFLAVASVLRVFLGYPQHVAFAREVVKDLEWGLSVCSVVFQDETRDVIANDEVLARALVTLTRAYDEHAQFRYDVDKGW